MESNTFGGSHLPSQALVVLSEAASGLHEALRNQRPFPTRLPDAKDLHNMSLVGSYGTHLLHSFHPHLLQSLNHGMLANGGPASYFASDRGLSKPVLTNFQLPSAFSPPKYIGISLDQNLFNSSNESFRTDSASPTCTSHESMEGSNDYDGEKGESPRSNNSDPRDLRHVHSSSGGGQQKNGNSRGHVPDVCPVCGIKLTPEEWNSHFLSELDRLYKLSAGMERANLQSNYMFAPPCPAQENAIRTSHNRWETFQRIRNNRQNRLRIKVRKRKYGSDMYFLDNLFCSSCPICKRKYSMETTKNSEEEPQPKDEIETVDVESCNDDVPDSGSEMNSSSSAGKLDGVLYRTACVINKESAEDDVTNSNNWESNPSPHISVKNVSELSSTTHHFYNADSCGEERNCNSKEIDTNTCNNDSDEDVIVDDDDSIKTLNTKKRKFEETISNRNENHSPDDERPRSEPQVTSTEPNIEMPPNNNNNNNNNKYNFEELRSKIPDSDPTGGPPATTGATGPVMQDSKVGISSDKPDEEYKCFICKTGIKEFSSDFFRGRNLYFHQSCANVMSTYRLSKDIQQQQHHHQQLLQQQQQQQQHQQQQQQQQHNVSNN